MRPEQRVLLDEWERGVSLASTARPDLRMYLWFYEWNLFHAMEAGPHTHGRWKPEVGLNRNQDGATLRHPGLRLDVHALDDGAALKLQVENTTYRDWPSIAALIPCFNPGDGEFVEPCDAFFDEQHERTWYLGRGGLALLADRSIHFSAELTDEVEARADRGKHVFSHKWPTAADPAAGGLLLRESSDRSWVTGIAWERFLSLQGHNPLRCMHQAVRVGPLRPGDRRTINGRIYLFPGSKEACLTRFSEAFASSHQAAFVAAEVSP